MGYLCCRQAISCVYYSVVSLKFPISLVGKRIPLTPTILYDVSDNIIVEIKGDIPNSWVYAGIPYDPVRIEVGSSCEIIGNQAFRYCSKLTTVTFAEGVHTISSKAFRDCAALTTLGTIPLSVTSLGGSDTFAAAQALTSPLVILNSECNLPYLSFWSTAFTTAYLAPPPQNIQGGQPWEGAFQGSSLTTVYAKDAVASGWTLGAGQTVGNKTGVTVLNWDNYPDPTPN